MKNILKNPFFHGAILGVCVIIFVVDYFITGVNSMAEMTMIGKIACVVFGVDLIGLVFYVVILRMIFKVK